MENTMDITIRRCVVGDEAALALLGQATFLETYADVLGGADIIAHCARHHAAAVYRDWLAQPDMPIWLAELQPGGAPVGYLVLCPPKAAELPVDEPRPDDLEIKRIYLLHRFQGQRIGRRLLDAALVQARQAGAGRVLLGVYAHNHAALAFYGRCGFVQVGERKFRVGETDYDDFIMGVEL